MSDVRPACQASDRMKERKKERSNRQETALLGANNTIHVGRTGAYCDVIRFTSSSSLSLTVASLNIHWSVYVILRENCKRRNLPTSLHSVIIGDAESSLDQLIFIQRSNAIELCVKTVVLFASVERASATMALGL